ncbi:hypothetical protein, partial [Streptomyces sp. NPDC059564]|uniref:hypothetical protein n=1 Tax=Streptomyces sp. NPDC059564 TaxID=3346865 RepID=UPI0036A15BE0
RRGLRERGRSRLQHRTGTLLGHVGLSRAWGIEGGQPSVIVVPTVRQAQQKNSARLSRAQLNRARYGRVRFEQ